MKSRVAASVAPSADGSAVAVADYGGRMWVRRGPARERLEMRLRLLEIVLAEIGEARIQCRCHGGGWLRFGHADQCDRSGVAASGPGRKRDVFPHQCQSVSGILRSS